MRHAAWALAYHGCDRKTGEKILAGEKHLLPSSNDYDWLGTGAYFWENSHARALSWAKFLNANPSYSKTIVSEPFVIGAIIDPGNCLDLTDEGSLQILKEAHLSIARLFKSLHWKLPQNERGHSNDHDLVKRKLDCAVINYLHRMRRRQNLSTFHTVRCPFTEGGSLFEGSKIHAKTHVQWCVRYPKKSIIAYFRPLKTE